ncbi:gamma-glutamylcyclotransferase family protein [Ilumatobacter nonamiensis]|uniref:gamma-glutamylcyclotransferase family protein n=1 Tax=Ilumatobacter nonamiensis TaxID=467093 RepID=UPI0011D1A0ED|nr:gamma-glutamylcyclotransferase family protein [Ilumatobacter nonamiensis]
MTRPDTPSVDHVFVYGTLRPGDVRWQFLEPYVVDEGWPDTVDGQLFDTGLDYPAAIFDERAIPGGLIAGQTYRLLAHSLGDCLDVLDREEDTVGGRYRRVLVVTGRGVTAYAYEYGSDLDLTPIDSGDWFAHRGLVPPSFGSPEPARSTLAP